MATHSRWSLAMLMAALLLTCVGLLPGCKGQSHLSDDDDPSEEPFSRRVPAQLVGRWIAGMRASEDINSTMVLLFKANGSYEQCESFKSSSTDKTVRIETGTFSVQGKRLTLNREEGGVGAFREK